MTCEAEAEPPASFAWFDQRGKPIREGAILTENRISTLVVSIFVRKDIRRIFKPENFSFQLPITHDDIFGEYSCEATNKMGSLARKVELSEGAKPGIPSLEIYKIDTESAQMTILVSIEELLSRKALKQFAFYIYLQEHPAELHLRIIGFEIEYKEKHLDWDLAYHQYFLKSELLNFYSIAGLLFDKRFDGVKKA